MRTFIGLIAALLVACGGDLGDEAEFGQLEQGYTAPQGYGYRVDLPNSQTRCFEPFGAPAGQVCVLPPDKVVRIRISSDGIGSAERTELEDLARVVYSNWETQLNGNSGWDLDVTSSSSADISVRYGTLSGEPITSIHRFARMTTINNTSALNDEGWSTEWRRYTGSNVCTIDKAAINASFSTTLERTRVRSHALYYCMLKPMGIGSRSSAVTKAYTIAVTPANAKTTTLGSRVRCYLNSVHNTTPPDLFVHSDCNNVTDN
jgi:hypothetical protein